MPLMKPTLTESEVFNAHNDDDEYDGVPLGVEAGQPVPPKYWIGCGWDSFPLFYIPGD